MKKEILKEMNERVELFEKTVCEITKITDTALSKLLNGEVEIDPEQLELTLSRLLDALQINPDKDYNNIPKIG